MSDSAQPIDMDAIWRRVLDQQAARERLTDAVMPENKAAILAALAAANITSVLVQFDGYGDSGQIESIDARHGELTVDLPEVGIAWSSVRYDGSAVDRRSTGLREALEELAYDLLGTTHPGWENNDGAFGELMFDVAEQSITLDHNSRYTEVNTSVHEW